MNRDSSANMALRLIVNNHPGVLSHVCGLFARRAFNLEGVLVAPFQEGNISTMWLLVKQDERLEQIIKQLRKLYDIIEVHAHKVEHSAFECIDKCMLDLGTGEKEDA